MLRAHVAAGLDPAAFWLLTPREWLVRMRGAGERLTAARASAATAAWVGTHLDGKGLDAWIERTSRGPAPPLSPDAVDRMLTHTAAGLPVLTMDDYRKMKGRAQ